MMSNTKLENKICANFLQISCFEFVKNCRIIDLQNLNTDMFQHAQDTDQQKQNTF